MVPRPRRVPVLAAALLALGGWLAPGAAGATLPAPLRALRAQLDRQARRLARRFAPRRTDQPPPWARRRDPPGAVLAVLADPHYDDSGTLPWARPTRQRLIAVCRFLRETIQPQAVLILGDLIANEHAPAQLRHVQALLDEHLSCPVLPVHGNHDGPGFESVFGPANYTKRIGGLRLIALGLTYWEWGSGWGHYARLGWLAETLAAHRDEPTLVLTHNPVCLPTFANNADVLRLLDAQPQVLAVLAGHLHTDYEMPLATLHLGLPMLIRPPYAFKVLRVHPDRILVLTYEEREGAYRQAPIYQKIDIPPALRPQAPPPASAEPPERKAL